jgi:hypothetical protein
MRPDTSKEVFHLSLTRLRSKKKKTEAAIIAIKPTKNVKITGSFQSIDVSDDNGNIFNSLS